MRNFINKKAKNVREGRYDKPVEKTAEIVNPVVVNPVVVNPQIIESVKVEPNVIEKPKKKKKNKK